MITLNMKMKKLLKALKYQKGFTLIELLVVIGILGILAAALIATIDPFEQLRKADDSKIKNMVVEFQNANVRYYTTHSSFPWNDESAITAGTNTGCTDLSAGAGDPTIGLTLTDMQDCVDNSSFSLVADGELKSSFTTNTNDLDKIYVTWDDASPTELIVCFSPVSKSQKTSPETVYDQYGDANASCDGTAQPDGTCFWCTR